MAIPEIIPIQCEPEYHTDKIGRHATGQYLGTVISAYPGEVGAGLHLDALDAPLEDRRWYAVLHLFDDQGRHVSSDIWFAGTSASGQAEVAERAKDRLTSMLAALVGRQNQDIAIRPFRADVDGVVFGLVPESDPDEGDSVVLYPDGLVFYEPWDGTYDT